MSSQINTAYKEFIKRYPIYRYLGDVADVAIIGMISGRINLFGPRLEAILDLELESTEFPKSDARIFIEIDPAEKIRVRDCKYILYNGRLIRVQIEGRYTSLKKALYMSEFAGLRLNNVCDVNHSATHGVKFKKIIAPDRKSKHAKFHYNAVGNSAWNIIARTQH